MRFFALATVPLLASAAAVVKRSEADIATAVSYIASNVTQLDNSVAKLGYNDTINGLIILFQSQDVINSVKNAQSVVEASADLTESESGALSIPVVQLVPKVKGLLTDIVNKKPEFETAFLGGNADFLVESNLQSSKSATDSFGSALTAKLSSTYAAIAPQIISQLDDAFNSAIATFSS